MKPEPLLLDDLLSTRLPAGPPMSHWLGAKKFVLDDKASFFVGDLLRRAPLELLQEHEFARVPFPVTWVEIDHLAYFRGLGLGDMIDDASDTKLGFLYHHGEVWQAVDAPQNRGILLPVTYHLHDPISPEQEMALANQCGFATRTLYRMCLLATVNMQSMEWWSSAEAESICRSHRAEFLGPDRFHRSFVRDWGSVMGSSAGSLKLILVLALLLTKPGQKVLDITEVAPRRAIVKGKSVALKAHAKVTVRLAHRDPVVRFTTALATGLHRRRHGVRGHWAQTRKLETRNCSHQWDAVTSDHYACTHCSARRWWRKAHMRGDVERGTLTKKVYEVTE